MEQTEHLALSNFFFHVKIQVSIKEKHVYEICGDIDISKNIYLQFKETLQNPLIFIS